MTDAELEELLDNMSDIEDVVDFSGEEEGEAEVIDLDDYDSGSEQSEDEDFQNQEYMEIGECDYQFYIAKDEENIWKSTPAPSNKIKAKNIIKVLPGSKGSAKNVSTRLESFFTFITTDMIDHIVSCTNIYIEYRKAKFPYQRERDCKLTSRSEIQALFGALFLIAVKKGNHVNVLELWSKDGTGMLILRVLFSYKRFLFLLRALRFDSIITRKDREKTDKLAAIRLIYTPFVTNCQNNYNLGEFVTIDEMLHPFRGRCGFVQYMPLKPARYGLKFYALCDSTTYYTWNFEIYCGAQRDGPYKTSNKPFDIVQRLVDPIIKSHRNLTTDNYYTSYPLAEYLLQNGLTLIGTMKKNKKEISPDFLPNKSRQVGSTLFGFQDDMTLVSYVSKKNKAVILLSTMHDAIEIDETTKKPQIILDYNSTKCGVDTVDQKCASYTTQRITRRWPLAIFFRLLDIAGINSEIIYNNTKPSVVPPRRRIFLNELAFELFEDHLKDRAKIPTLPKDVTAFLSKYHPAPVEAFTQNSNGRCHICSSKKNNRTTVTCSSCQHFVCKGHSTKTVTCQNCLATQMEEEEED